MTDRNIQKADWYIGEAKKKLTRGFLAQIFGWMPKYEEAIQCYQKAANLLKMCKSWAEAAAAFFEAGKLNIELESYHEAATNFVDAANCYRKCDSERTVDCYLRVIDIYTDMGKFAMAAKHHAQIGEIYEKDASKLETAVQHFEQAADYYFGEESNTFANKYLLKVADHCVTLEQYEKGLEIYERLAVSAVSSNLIKFSIKEYLFKAALCHLSLDVVNAILALKRYESSYPLFVDSREYKLVKCLINCVEEDNADDFTQAIADYDRISKLDGWSTTILLRIKKKIGQRVDLR